MIPRDIADDWVRKKHYTHRPSMFSFAFGLVDAGVVLGVVVYGPPPLQIAKHACPQYPTLELTRLVIQATDPNSASFLIGGSLRMLPRPTCVVSYADELMGHVGIVYQATNWLYTGAVKSRDKIYCLPDGTHVHPRTLASRGITAPSKWAMENNVVTRPMTTKHRYFYLVGDRRQKEAMRAALRYPICPYPKAPKQTYDDGPVLVTEL